MISLRNISVCGQLQSDFTGPADGCLPREIWDTKITPKHPKPLALMRAGTQVGPDPFSGEVLEFLVEHEPIKPSSIKPPILFVRDSKTLWVGCSFGRLCFGEEFFGAVCHDSQLFLKHKVYKKFLLHTSWYVVVPICQKIDMSCEK